MTKKEINITEKDFEISPALVKSYVSNDEFLMLYDNNLFCPNLINGGKVKINLKDLEKKINSFYKKEEYIKIKSYDVKRTLLSFDIEKWLKDSVKKASVISGSNKFQKSIKLIKLPTVVMEVNEHIEISKFIETYFKKFLNKNLIKELESSVLKDFGKKLGKNFYDFKYNYDSNKIVLSIKDIYSNIATATLANAVKNPKKIDKIDFDKSVYTMLKYCKKS